MTQTPRAPSYHLHKGNFARVVIDRKSIYLGKYESEESHRKYRELIATWSANLPTEPKDDDQDVTVAEVLEAYRVDAHAYYGESPGGRYRLMLPTIRTVRELYADLPASEFSPKKLKVVRQASIDAGFTRGHVNQCVQRVVRMLRWAVEEELVEGSVVHALEAVQPLRVVMRKRRRGAVESVDQSVVDATLPHLTPVLQDMVRLQLTTGCRPGELCRTTSNTMMSVSVSFQIRSLMRGA